MGLSWVALGPAGPGGPTSIVLMGPGGPGSRIRFGSSEKVELRTKAAVA